MTFATTQADNAELVQALVVPCKFDDERLQGARLKSAWNSVVRAEKASDMPGADIQLDEEELLPSATLNSLKELHYAVITFALRLKLHLVIGSSPSCPVP